ncbi:MAG TPA: HAD-IIB family hydrolase [Verrucomicrobiae bacterium]|nr:HAD-IIB family hydrolase [Verrucomicrobiae bacterium]
MTNDKVQLFCADLDGTLLGNPEATRRFKDTWEALPKKQRPLLCYNSGRLVQNIIDLLATKSLPWPDHIIGGVGTQIYDGRQKRPLGDFNKLFRPGWDLKKIESILTTFPGVTHQPPQFLHPYKSSWYLHQAPPETVEQLKKLLADAGLEVNVIYSSMRDLDVMPQKTNKGYALQWLCEKISVPLNNVLVAGDTGNDSSMFLLPGVRGIVVENAQPELFEAVVKLPTFSASQVLADGVIEGLKYFGVIPDAPSLESSAMRAHEMDPTLRMLFTEAALGTLTSEERQLICTGYDQALTALRKNITPLGFSACSLDDNEVTGTDVNYRSVWARDGSITLISTIELEDPQVRAAQKQTLRTLLDHISPNGQIPANVRIDTRTPDYSGVGGICSIDGGLLTVIAFYHYVNKTQDHDLLNEYSDRLQRVMNWLSALDSNNDGLLEIPEAGDWTDLFGRSYHVLYDEILWYRANVCFGRLLEFQKKFEPAADYLRWSQFIRGKILASFWPSTKTREAPVQVTFADRQFSLGDSSYLLAEVTPFSYSWRCDVLGNILAFLNNVLDVDRARVAFKFMWGVGVNDPWPVANLYPPVQAGDPDWRAYYTVNLLNLPGHYHNGGIWPFIGGMWVRFIHRLGLYEVACRELLKLAQLNRLGKNQEWEFNEWVHGRTGIPMGKCFQAWSAASYIHACQELQISPDSLPHD